MSPLKEPLESLIWVTRGRSWGFRFLLNGGRPDPLVAYEHILADLGDELETLCRKPGSVALRFPDPLGRQDAAGRTIPHEFIVFGELADKIGTLEDGRRQVWDRVAGAYARVWDAERAPSTADLLFTT